MLILCIDPGPDKSGVCLYQPLQRRATPVGHIPNEVLLDKIGESWHTHVVCEWITSYGMAVGASVFETCYWAGRFEQVSVFEDIPFIRIPRRDVKLQLCGSSRAKDANVRQAVVDRFPATGGGANPTQGTKAAPGPLYGVTGHLIQALAAGVAWYEQHVLEARARTANLNA